MRHICVNVRKIERKAKKFSNRNSGTVPVKLVRRRLLTIQFNFVSTVENSFLDPKYWFYFVCVKRQKLKKIQTINKPQLPLWIVSTVICDGKLEKSSHASPKFNNRKKPIIALKGISNNSEKIVPELFFLIFGFCLRTSSGRN